METRHFQWWDQLSFFILCSGSTTSAICASLPFCSVAILREDTFVLLRVMLLRQTSRAAILLRLQLERVPAAPQPAEPLIDVAGLASYRTHRLLLVGPRNRQTQRLIAIRSNGITNSNEPLPRRRAAPVQVDARPVVAVSAALHAPEHFTRGLLPVVPTLPEQT